MKRNRYFIGGRFWVQKPLTYPENKKVEKILGKTTFDNLDQQKLGEMLGKMYEDGQLENLFPIVLKPYNSYGLFVWNLIAGLFKKKEVIQYMTDAQIAKVMLDFFILRTSWINDLLRSTKTSKLSRATRLMNLFRVKKQSTSSAGAI